MTKSRLQYHRDQKAMMERQLEPKEGLLVKELITQLEYQSRQLNAMLEDVLTELEKEQPDE